MEFNTLVKEATLAILFIVLHVLVRSTSFLHIASVLWISFS